MELALTKMSQNGQVVIPAAIRKQINAKPQTQFAVYVKDGIIQLKQLGDDPEESAEFLAMIERSERDFADGNYISVDGSATPDEMLEALEKWK